MPRALLLLPIAALACGPARDELAASRAPVLGGTLSPPGDEDAVLLLSATASATPSICSATLIAPNLAISARHCVAAVVEGAFRCSPDGELIDSVDGAGTLGREYPPETLELYGGPTPRSEPLAVGAAITSTRSTHVCTNDLALVRLDRALDLPVAPIRFEPALEAGERVTLIGYGSSGIEPLDLEQDPRRKRTGVIVDAVGPDSILDGPGDAPPRSFVVTGPTVCLGDSGGPARSESDGGLVGVYSLQAGFDCGARDVQNFFVHVPPFRRLLEQAFAEAGAEPWIAGRPDPRLIRDGEPCGEDAACRSGRCDGARCATACDAQGECAGAQRCEPGAGPFGLCVPDEPVDPGEPSEPMEPSEPGEPSTPSDEPSGSGSSAGGCALGGPAEDAHRALGLVALALLARRRRAQAAH